MISASAIAVVAGHSCAIQAGTGAVWCWGHNRAGEATPPPSVDGSAGTALAVAASWYHTLAIAVPDAPIAIYIKPGNDTNPIRQERYSRRFPALRSSKARRGLSRQLREVVRPDVVLRRFGPGFLQTLREPDQQLVNPHQLPIGREAGQEVGHHATQPGKRACDGRHAAEHVLGPAKTRRERAVVLRPTSRRRCRPLRVTSLPARASP
jgi:hypothetical protein